jgi:carboxypeptidase Q
MRTAIRATTAFLITTAAFAAPTRAQSQEPIDHAMIARIKAEGLERSQMRQLFHTLTDLIGPRLTGSPKYNQSAAWARDRFAEWGLANPRLEPFEFGRGWSLEKLSIEMLSPWYMPLTGYAEAWTPSTRGVLSGPAVYLGDKTFEQIVALESRMRDAIVLTHLPQMNFLEADRVQPADFETPVRIGAPAVPGLRTTTPMQQVTPRLRGAGAGVTLRPNSFQHGTVQVLGSRTTPNDAVPSIILAVEHYNMLARMAESGLSPELRVELRSRYHEDDTNSYNVVAEIPGTDPALRDEIVLIGAHLDSWHTATGATDNGDGVVGAMEAIRILAAVGARPRRTIQVVLFGGEEQGLLGARAYLERHMPDAASRDRLAVFLNDDPGTGATYGFYMQDNPAAKPIFDAWLEPLRDLGMRRNVIGSIGSTDHVPFDQINLPGFTAIKDYVDYDVRSRHTNTDFFERVAIEDLQQSAVVMAVFAWHAAQRDERIPRKPSTSAANP